MNNLVTNRQPAGQRLLPVLFSHLEWFLAHAPMRGYGPRDGAMWMSSLDLHTGRTPTTERPPGIAKRCYRLIESPGGANLYWDLPLLATCCELGVRENKPEYRHAAMDYMRDYLGLATDPAGLFYWANHYFLEAASGEVVWFCNDELRRHPGPASYHETRPLRVPWELFFPDCEAAVRRSVEAQAVGHVVDEKTGEFNRHADRLAQHPFLESGGILVETLCYGGVRWNRPDLIDLAERIAGFSFEARDPETGLLPGSPRFDRWDKYTATSEIGLWAGCLLKAFDLTGRESFFHQAREGVAAWLRHAWDAPTGQFFGRLWCAGGKADRGERTSLYQPDVYCDFWEPLFPTHDYPFQMAQVCLELALRTDDDVFREGVAHWLRHFTAQWPPAKPAYAEACGRALHWLDGVERAGFLPAQADLRPQLVDYVGENLQKGELFRSHPGEDRVDAVDGMGFLLWAIYENCHGAQPSRYDPF